MVIGRTHRSRIARQLGALWLLSTPLCLHAQWLEIPEVESSRPPHLFPLVNSGVNSLLNEDGASHGEALLVAAVHHGSPLAARHLAYAHSTGKLLPADAAKARQFFKFSIAQGDDVAMLEYGLLLYYGHVFERDREQGLEIIQRSARLANPIAASFVIGVLGTSDDPRVRAAAGAWKGTLPEDAIAFGQVALATLFEFGDLLQQDPPLQDFWSSQVDSELYAVAAGSLGLFYVQAYELRRALI